MTRTPIFIAVLIAIAVTCTAEPSRAAHHRSPWGAGASWGPQWPRCRTFDDCIWQCNLLPNDKRPYGRKFGCFMWCIHTCPPD